MNPFNRRCIVSLFLMAVVPTTIFAQMDSLRARIERMIGNVSGTIGVAVRSVETGDTLSVNGHRKFPMQSVFKFPVALAVLDRVDKGKLSLDQKIYLKKEYMLPNTWSPLREKYPNGDTTIVLDEVLALTVSKSDNIGCDLLFRLLGGPVRVNQYIHRLGIKEMEIVATEQEMHKDEKVQYRNWSSPVAMAELFRTFYRDPVLSHKGMDYLLQLMVNTSTGPNRIKGMLPPGTIVAHKTGSSGEDAQGMAAATNDAGIVTLPNGTHIIIVVFVSNSRADEKARDQVIAGVAKTVWDYYHGQ